MSFFNYTLDLPYTKIKIRYREINTEEQIYLAKANLSFPNTKEAYIDYNNFLLNLLSNCIDNFEDFKKINIVEYVLFLTKLRIISIGNTMEFIMENDSKVKTKIKINLNSYLLKLYEASNFFENDDNVIKNENIEVKLNWPSLKSIDLFNELSLKQKSEYELLDETLQEYIDWIKINDKLINFSMFDSKQKNKLLNTLPFQIKSNIQNKIIESLGKLLTQELFDVGFFKEQKFNFYNLSFLEHVKILFSNDIKSLFYEVYILSSSNVATDYLIKLSPNERKMYLAILEEQKKREDRTSSGAFDNIQDDIDPNEPSQAVKDLAFEFNDEPPK